MLSNPTKVSREQLLELVDEVSRQDYLFYGWLIQYDLLTEELAPIVNAVLATMLWRKVVHFIGHSPDLLPFDVLQMIARSQPSHRAMPTSVEHVDNSLDVQPTTDSPWQDLYLDATAYHQAVEQIQAVLHTHMQGLADARDAREERFDD